MTREELKYTISSCGCFIYRGHIYYEESELIKAFEDLGLIKQQSMPAMYYPQVEGITPTVVEPIPDVNKEVECYDLISRQAVLKIIDGWYENNRNTENIEDLIILITYMASFKPQEPKTGHWKVMYEPKNMVVCSKCGKCAYLYNNRGSAYCPHCGDYKGE